MELITGSLALARRLEAADARNAALLAEAHQRLRGTEPPVVLTIGGGAVAYAGAGSPLTHAIGVGMNGPVTPADFDAIEDFYFSRESNVNIDLCPLADASLTELLGARGYRIVEFNDVMARRVAGPVEFADPRVEIITADNFEKWARTLAAGFFEHEPSEDELDIGRNLTAMEDAVAYLARVNGVAAAGGAASVHGGLASLFGDATLTSYRGRGLQTALINARLADAWSHGADLATASTVPGTVSHRNYERCGFRVVYTKLNMQRDCRARG